MNPIVEKGNLPANWRDSDVLLKIIWWYPKASTCNLTLTLTQTSAQLMTKKTRNQAERRRNASPPRLTTPPSRSRASHRQVKPGQLTLPTKVSTIVSAGLGRARCAHVGSSVVSASQTAQTRTVTWNWKTSPKTNSLHSTNLCAPAVAPPEEPGRDLAMPGHLPNHHTFSPGTPPPDFAPLPNQTYTLLHWQSHTQSLPEFSLRQSIPTARNLPLEVPHDSALGWWRRNGTERGGRTVVR